MGSIFERPEPDICVRYYDKGEGLWHKVKRHIRNIFRQLSGNDPLDYDEQDVEFEDALDEWAYFNDK